MNEQEGLAERFEGNRTHLRAVAYRMLGSLSKAGDAVQEAWLRLSPSDADGLDNLAGWLATVVARVCLDMLRARKSRSEVSAGVRVPEPIASWEARLTPEHGALLANTVGLAMVVVLERLAPAERLAFVLHDMFAVPFDEIARVGALPGRGEAAREPGTPSPPTSRSRTAWTSTRPPPSW